MRCLNYLILSAATTMALAPASAQEQKSLLGELLRVVSGNRSTAASPAELPRGLPAGGRGGFSVAMTPEQTTGLQAALSVKIGDPVIARDVAEARPLIEKLVTIGACNTSDAAWNATNVDRLNPKTFNDYIIFTIVGTSKYHDKRFCFDVQRVGSWSKPAKNALSFQSWYVSSQSGEAGTVSFELIKTPEGRWMIR